jgi:ABC-type Fe3+-siderophore transport system permease subunit
MLISQLPGTEVGLSSSTFAVCSLLGAAAVAVWLDLRFPRLTPATVKSILLHVGGALVAAQLLSPLAFHFLTGSRASTLAVVFVVALPALTYALLVALWVLRFLANASRGRFW